MLFYFSRLKVISAIICPGTVPVHGLASVVRPVPRQEPAHHGQQVLQRTLPGKHTLNRSIGSHASKMIIMIAFVL